MLSPNGVSRAPALDYFGEHVAFESDASNLIGGDTNGRTDIYLRWRITPVTAYCTSSTTTHGCSPYMNADGVASVSSHVLPPSMRDSRYARSAGDADGDPSAPTAR